MRSSWNFAYISYQPYVVTINYLIVIAHGYKQNWINMQIISSSIQCRTGENELAKLDRITLGDQEPLSTRYIGTRIYWCIYM